MNIIALLLFFFALNVAKQVISSKSIIVYLQLIVVIDFPPPRCKIYIFECLRFLSADIYTRQHNPFGYAP